MAKSAPSFEDRISLIAAELSELGKRPVSSETYDELTSLQERLGDIVGEFIMCEGCSGMFPAAVQVTIGDVTATLCRNCAITAIQKDTLELSPERAAPRPRRSESLRSNRPKSDSQPARISVPEPVDDDDDVSVDGDEPEPDESSPEKPAPYVSRPRTRSQSRSIRKASTTDDDEVFVRTNPKRATSNADDDGEVESTHFGVRPSRTRKPVSGPFEIEGSDSDTSVDDVLSAPRARSARPPKAEEPVLKASYVEVAKHLDRTTREVRQIGKLVEEISPPMDVEKTTRYVLAELRNQRSKIPLDIVPRIVSALKKGVPSKDNGNAKA